MTRLQPDCITPVQSRTAAVTLPQSELRRSATPLRFLALFIGLGIAAILAANASGQNAKYDVLPVDKAIDDDLVRYQRAASGYASARDVSTFPANQVGWIQKYFQQYVPAKITQPDSTYVINDLMGHATSTMDRAVRSRTPGGANVMRWLYLGLKPVAMGNYQPSARINAIGFISRLARPPADRGGLPRPYPFVLTDMKAIYLDTANPDAVRAAALQGIERFVRFTPTNQIDQKSNQEITQAMTELLQADAPTSRDALAHAFLQRYAVNILTNLSTDASLGKQLVSISTDENNPNLIALYSAAAIANLPGKMAEGDVETKAVLMLWAKRILKSYETEIDRLAAMEKKMASTRQPAPPESYLKETKDPNEQNAARAMAGGGGMMMDDEYGMEMEEMDMEMDMDMDMDMDMMGMMGGARGMMGMMGTEKPQPPEVVASRKQLNLVLQQVLLGVTGEGKVVEDVEFMEPSGGLMAATPADSLDDVKSWLQAINDVTVLLNDRMLGTRRDYVKALEEQVLTLTSLSKGESVTKRAVVPFNPFAIGNPLDAPAEPPAAPPADAGDAGLNDLLNN